MSYSVYGDISGFEVISSKNKLKKYIFYSECYNENKEDKEVLLIQAEKVEIFQVGTGASTLFTASKQKKNIETEYCLPLDSDYLNRQSATFFIFDTNQYNTERTR